MLSRKVGKVVFNGKRNSYGEYVVKVYDVDEHHWESADYYTDDLQDAEATYAVMVRAMEIQNRKGN